MESRNDRDATFPEVLRLRKPFEQRDVIRAHVRSDDVLSRRIDQIPVVDVTRMREVIAVNSLATGLVGLTVRIH